MLRRQRKPGRAAPRPRGGPGGYKELRGSSSSKDPRLGGIGHVAVGIGLARQPGIGRRLTHLQQPRSERVPNGSMAGIRCRSAEHTSEVKSLMRITYAVL